MKKTSFQTMLWLAAIGAAACPLAAAQHPSLQPITPLALQVSCSKTLSVSFPSAIKSVDRGTSELLAQIAGGTQNVLLIKAAKQQMPPTSLTVITQDAELYSFQVSYQHQPSQISLELVRSKDSQQPRPAQLCGPERGSILQTNLALASSQPGNLLGIKDKNQKVSLAAKGIYISGRTLFLTLAVENRSLIGYDIASLRLFVADSQQAKRTAIQQREMMPLQISPQPEQIQAGQHLTLVVALEKFTLPKSKHLSVQLTEGGGARNLRVSLKASDLRKIIPLQNAY